MNPLNRPKKEDKQKKAAEDRQKLRTALREKSAIRTGINPPRPNNHTTPASYAEAAKSSLAPAPQTQSPGSISDAFNQLKDPEISYPWKSYNPKYRRNRNNDQKLHGNRPSNDRPIQCRQTYHPHPHPSPGANQKPYTKEEPSKKKMARIKRSGH
ncbi:hypothetical protein NPIL_518431 [Nephila pilipes]|uniref:Uncharacterized protein n=1 Tax=Nephila pilipes TaxID=299642 RepID=A0A8X6QKV3_NEPPI|nr:hypothetical protein NPIL_518431 [Nephila pilipes]